MRNGRRDSIIASALEKFANALFLHDAFSVHPVAMSTTVRVRQKSPFRLGPQWATVSASTLPGSPSSSSPAFLIVIELRNSSPAGLVPARPFGLAASRVFLRYRSIVAGLIAMSSLNANPSYSASSPWALSVGSHRGSICLRYFAHGRSIISHTRTSSSRDCSEYRFGRDALLSGSSRGFLPASASLRLAVLLPISNTEHISSRMRPLSFFEAFMYSSLNLRVTCRFVAMLILPSM